MQKRTGTIILLLVIVATCLFAKPDIGVMWYTKSAMAERVYEGFELKIRQLAPDVNIELKPGIADMKDVEATYQRFAAEKDAIVFLRSHGAKYLLEHPIDIPGFIGAANNPVKLGIVDAHGATPQKNITGVSYYLDTSVQINLFQKLIPDVQTIGLLLWDGHPATIIELEGTEKACKAKGLKLEYTICRSPEEINQATEKMRENVDLIIISSANHVTEQTPNILENAGNTPVVSYAENAVKAGALAGMVPDDRKLGEMLADTVYQVLVAGKPVLQVPVRYDTEPQLIINRNTLKKYQIVIPPTLMKMAEFVD